MSETVKEYIDSFIMDVNQIIKWKYLKSRRELKKQINELVFQIDFYSSKYNYCSDIEIRSECRIWCKRYDRSLTMKSGIAGIPFRTDAEYWWDITDENSREKVFLSMIEGIKTKVLPVVEELEKDYSSGLLKLIYRYGFDAFSNSIQLIDEFFGREEALKAANAYSEGFKKTESNILKRYIKGECCLENERNLHYMVENRLITISGERK